MSVESRFLEQSYQATIQLPSYKECRQLIHDMQGGDVLQFEGPQGARVLQEQFQGTLIADAFMDLPENTPVTMNDIMSVLAGTVLDYERRTGVVGIINRQVTFRKDGEMKTEDESYYPQWRDAARTARETAFAVVPGMEEPDRDYFTVIFTPMMKRSNQFLLEEEKLLLVKDPSDPSGLRQFTLSWDQYRIFEHDDAGIWHERGSLMFLDLAEYDDMHDPEYPGENDVIGFSGTFFINHPSPPEFFNRDAHDPDAVLEMYRTVFAPIPTALAFYRDATSQL